MPKLKALLRYEPVHSSDWMKLVGTKHVPSEWMLWCRPHSIRAPCVKHLMIEVWTGSNIQKQKPIQEAINLRASGERRNFVLGK